MRQTHGGPYTDLFPPPARSLTSDPRAAAWRRLVVETHVSTQYPQAFEDPRFPPPHAHQGGASSAARPSRPRAEAALRLIWRIRDRANFEALARAPRRRAGGVSLRYVSDNTDDPARVAYAIGRHVGSAVVRNRIRRRLRAAVAQHESELLAGGAYLLWRILPLYLAAPLVAGVGGLAAALAFVQWNGRPFISALENGFYFLIRSKLYLWNNEQKTTKQQARSERQEIAPAAMYIPKLSESKLRNLAWSLDIKERIAAGVAENQEREGGVVLPIRTAREARI